MMYRGRIQNGVVVLDAPNNLEEGTEVQVEILSKSKEQRPLGKELLRFAGIAEDLPPDIAKNHDHYLHGLPKK
jgi:hypothetical protein